MKRRGFTLVELMVVILVVIVLIGLVLIAIRASRGSAVATKCLINERSCAQAFGAYAGDFRDAFPMWAQPRLNDAFQNGGVSLGYYDQGRHWPMALRGYMGEGVLNAAQLCPTAYAAIVRDGVDSFLSNHPSGYTQPSGYEASHTLTTDPKLWAGSGLSIDESGFRTVFQSEVASPSAKGMLVEAWSQHQMPSGNDDAWRTYSITSEEGQSSSYPVAFCDYSARYVRASELTRGFVNVPTRTFAAPVLCTPGGVRGYDVR